MLLHVFKVDALTPFNAFVVIQRDSDVPYISATTLVIPRSDGFYGGDKLTINQLQSLLSQNVNRIYLVHFSNAADRSAIISSGSSSQQKV